jgi:uncharacterized Fe-S cluster-containing protein
MTNAASVLMELPGKNCGLCGQNSCESFAEAVASEKSAMEKCPFKAPKGCASCDPSKSACGTNEVTWKDHLGREYDFVLDKFASELGPRETVLPFNPTLIEKLGIKKGDVLFGRPGWISCGCPVTHAGIVVEEPDYFNGTVVWCVVGPMMARERGIDIGYYNSTAYEGLVKDTRVDLQIGMRYYFQPRFCMLQWRHCGLVNSIAKTPEGLRVRIEGLWIG